MTSKVVSLPFKAAADRQNIQQNFIARETHRAKSTINGYFNDVPTPVDAMVDIAKILNDSELSHELAHETFGTIPMMQSCFYQENTFSLDILQKKESDERKFLKNEVELILAKQDNWLTDTDKLFLEKYVNEFLDEILIEIKLISSIAERTDKSLMELIAKRKAYWKQIGYLEKR